jgi:hypothetical protein
MASELSPLLGAIHLPEGVYPRIHYLDNLRAVLTILLIFQHSILEVFQSSQGFGWTPTPESVFLSIFVAINKSILLPLFFFVAGYSTYLSVKEKGGHYESLRSRLLKIGLPALLWVLIGRTLLYYFLGLIGLGRVFDVSNEYKAQTRMVGPVGFVIALLIFDTIFLALHRIGQHHPLLHIFRPLKNMTSTGRRFFLTASLSWIITLVFAYFSCLGVRFYVGRFYRSFVYDIREFPNSPAPFVVAYIAGVSFPFIKQYLVFCLRKSVIALVTSEILAYLSLGIAQHVMPSLWKSIRFRDRFSGPVYFFLPGFNPHTIFYIFWTTLVFYSLSISVISVFAQSPLTKKDWGVWTRHTYPQIYIHMVPIVLAIHILPTWEVMGGILAKSVLVGIIGVACSWVIVLLSTILCDRIATMRSRGWLR